LLFRQACIGMKNLQTINASYCDRLQRPEFSGHANLRAVKLEGCVGILKVTIERCPLLETLDVRGCSRLEPDQVVIVTEVSGSVEWRRGSGERNS
jgi:hypothetical protein